MREELVVTEAAWCDLKCVLVAWAERHVCLPALVPVLLWTAVDLHSHSRRIDYEESRDDLAQFLGRMLVPEGSARDPEDEEDHDGT